MKNIENIRKEEQGFTLVELAIVMIIIGLLIGGVLKGQELITNARVNATVSQVRNFTAAKDTFRDIYKSFPGDMRTAAARLPNCGVGNCQNGSGNGVISTAANAIIEPNTAADITAEALGFWAHLTAADLIAGASGVNATYGQGLPASDFNGGFTIGYTNDTTVAGLINNDVRAGHYISLRATEAVGAVSYTAVPAAAAFRVDQKMDDGAPNSGGVRALGTNGAAAANCADGNTETALYNEQLNGQSCGLLFRVN